MSRPSAALRPSLALLASLALVLPLGLGAPARAAAPATPADTPGATPARVEAEQALARVERLLDPALASAAAPGKAGQAGADAAAQPSRDATLALLDLTRTRGALTGADAARAATLLARPSLGSSTCSSDICVHYTTTGANAVDATDVDADNVPDYVEVVLATMQTVHDTYVGAGYRQPKSDGTRGGGTGKDDVYLRDIGDRGLYGYCQTDESSSASALYGFCVLDNDYARGEFPTNTPLENLQVTAAHEYFHAVQFAYDAYEDAWLLEATATWMEDEVFPDVDDNVQYLEYSPMSNPGTPLDLSNSSGFFYGTWSFFRYLTERFTDQDGGLPTLVRDIWRRADATSGAPDDYSWQAVRHVLKARGSDAAAWLASYAAANRRPGAAYAEGRANGYPSAPLSGRVELTRSKRERTFNRRLDHLTSGTLQFTPQGLGASDWTLRLQVDMSDARTGSLAVVTIVDTDGDSKVLRIPLGAAGNGSRTVKFSSNEIRQVEVTLVNASGRFRCGKRTAYSCQGTSRDDNRLQSVTATVRR